AAGIPYFIAAGNEATSQSPPWSLRCPGNVPSPWHHPAAESGGLGGSISIGATDNQDNIANFSSRGPVTWDTIDPYFDYPYPPGLLKPDFSAPGVDVISTRRGGGYTEMSGTSMATPCAAGVCALMLEKNPELLPEEVDSIMQSSVLPLGTPPKNNTFGTGRIDAMLCIANTPFPFGLRYVNSVVDDSAGGNNDGIINPGETINLPVWVKNACDYAVRGAYGILRTEDSLITVTDSFRYFGTIGEGDTGYTGDSGFGFAVASSCTNGYALEFDLVLSDTLDSTWVAGLKFVCGTPQMMPDSVYAYDGGNGKLDPGEETDIAIQLLNSGKGHGYDVSAILVSGDTRLEVLDSTGTYGQVPADSWAMNDGDRFRVRADGTIPREFPVPCTLRISQTGYQDENVPFFIEVGRLTAVDPIPDGPRRPSLYYAYDDADSGYTEAPRYEWFEINGVGTRLVFPQNDDVLVVDLPAEFGPFKYYGQRYTQVSISADGWVCPGNYTVENYSNTGLPSSEAPPAICLNWDDLYPNYQSQGYVYHYHDADNHRFVIEYDSVSYYSSRTVRDKFQMLICDTTMANVTGNNDVVVQYMTANLYNSSTVGLQDQSMEIGIQCLFNGEYHRASAGVVEGRAIKYTTDSTVTGVADAKRLGGKGRLALMPLANPFRGSVGLRFNLPKASCVTLKVYDASGRVVRELVDSGSEQMRAGLYTVRWDGRDHNGRAVAAGIYLYRLETSEGSIARKAVMTR
ncbi:MAG: S8 family serine peptidase, partial [candidate division WOR-3 bacterium]